MTRQTQQDSNRVTLLDWVVAYPYHFGASAIAAVAIVMVVTLFVPTKVQPEQAPASIPLVVSTPIMLVLPTVDPAPYVVPNFPNITMAKVAKVSQPVIEGARPIVTGNVLRDQVSAFYAAFARDDIEQVGAIGGWFRNNSALSADIESARLELIHGLDVVFSKEVTNDRFTITVKAAKALYDLGAQTEGDKLVEALLNLPPEEMPVPTAVFQPLPLSGNNSTGETVSQFSEDSPPNFSVEEEVPAYVTEALPLGSLAIGASPIPTFWSISSLYNWFTTGNGSFIVEGTYYLVDFQEISVSTKFAYAFNAMEVDPNSASQLQYYWAWFSKDPTSTWNQLTTETFFDAMNPFGKLPAYVKIVHDPEAAAGWGALLFLNSGVDLGLRVGTKVIVQTAGPIVLVH